MLNEVNIIGYLGNDPDMRQTNDGKAVANISVATTEKWKDKSSGEDREKTEWHRVVFFEPLSNIVHQYLVKGSLVYVKGKLVTRKWQDQSGNDRYTTEIVCGGFGGVMRMLGGKRKEQDQQQEQGGGSGGGRQRSMEEDLDDEIPF